MELIDKDTIDNLINKKELTARKEIQQQLQEHKNNRPAAPTLQERMKMEDATFGLIKGTKEYEEGMRINLKRQRQKAAEKRKKSKELEESMIGTITK